VCARDGKKGLGDGEGCIQISVIMRAGTEPNCLPERKQLHTLCVCVCVCVCVRACVLCTL